MNAQLVPQFEEKNHYYHLRVHFRRTIKFGHEFWGDEFWERILRDKFWRRILEAFQKEIRGKLFREKVLEEE